MTDAPADLANANAIGRSLRRIEDRPLLTGQAAFAADLRVEGQVHMRVVRSPVAFGRITEIDVDEALELPGVIAVWTHADVAALPQIDFRMTRIEGLGPYRQWVLARDFVRYVGEPMAVVFAETGFAAEDAADLIFAEIDELDAHLSATADPVEVYPGVETGLLSEPAVIRKGAGDVDAAFAAADRVVELEVAVGRHTGVPLETRGALAQHDPDSDVVTMMGAAKVPHYNRGAIATMLGLPTDKVQLSEQHVGGGFGIRGELYPEDVLVCHAARVLGRPIRWIEDRKEHLLAANHSRDQAYRLRAAVDPEGVILGLDAAFYTDQGAYVRTHGGTVTDLAAAMLPGPYRIPAYRVAGHIRLTNKTPAGTYRAPGRFESTFARERLMDEIADQCGLSRSEVRRRNLIPEAAMPFDRQIDTLGTHLVYDSGKYADLLERFRTMLDLDRTEDALAERRDAGEMAGCGLGFFVEKSGLGPDDLVRLHLSGDGTIRIVTGVASVGQGVETTLAQVCAGTLGIGIDGIEVIHGQTSLIEKGMGAFATRVTVMAGSAVKIAAEALIAKATEAAAKALGADPADLTFDAGRVSGPSGALTLAEAAQAAGGEIVAEGLFETTHMTYPYGIHFAQVSVDPETCGVTIERYAVAYDIGRMVNPMLVEGQLVGAVAQGVGGALLEEFVYDEAGQPLATSLADYLMPTAMEMPEVELLIREDAPSPINPLGVKGAGEGGINGAGAALAGAVSQALGRRVDRLPMTPERIYRWIRG
ncbi:xanthine dehydrogenase family protein molybdopterin-binding subunit [Roseisalinus antarcticus]|uniref:6-hydroxypseudooxynicotine dehydrogenase complex subunit gamma n=1 Tax=Roseisalinus antarcticus TaxID=254357 RepID=A0A1Y5TRX7_9RHOB|nr:xanthine dehydrogenase family protein molybdopterin-binding subunit [Roseisalinus antarcticus]SLN70674.1 6-hydroxypseudooxynicotine dehydrogenase complex subunit gamma [Roseisalinus antarcticus]